MKQKIVGTLCFFILICNFFSAYGYSSNIKYTPNSDIKILISDILNQIDDDKYINILEYSFLIEGVKTSKIDDFVTDLQKKVIEYLDDLLLTSPDIKTKIKNTNKVMMIITIDTAFSSEFITFIDNLVQKSNSYTNVEKKINLLADYVYENNFTYCYDYAFKYGELTSSTITKNPLTTADGVFKEKEGICVGYANLMSVYLDELNIPNLRLRGTTVDNYLHTWNLAYFEKNGVTDWYPIDLLYALNTHTTNDIMPKKEEYDLFVKSDLDILEDLKYLKYFSNNKVKDYFFKDIENHWAKESILNLKNKGVIAGYPDITFRPDNNITKSEMLLLLYRVLEKGNAVNSLDVAYNYFFINNIIDIKKEELLKYVTREELAYYLYNVIDYKWNLNSENLVIPNDYETISDKYKESVLNIYNLRIMQGVDINGTFNSTMNVNRAQIAVILERVLNLYME